LLVTIGLYGVVAYAVAQRTQEIGIRIALGATRRQVVANVMRPGMVMTLGGILLGLVGALMSTRLMTGLLYEVTATDVATFATAVTIALGTAFGACLTPAVKASLIDPVRALRSD
jgi:putative ABC transport system permease protein